VPNLRLGVEGTEGAAGTIEVTFGLTNISPTTCVMWGYPGGQMYASNGSQIATYVHRGGTLSFENIPVSTVTIGPGQAAWFNLGYSDVPVGNESSCPSSSTFRVIPPNTTEQLATTITMDPCGGGSVYVSPVFDRNSAFTDTTAPPGT
jgi:hypothetical protein